MVLLQLLVQRVKKDGFQDYLVKKQLVQVQLCRLMGGYRLPMLLVEVLMERQWDCEVVQLEHLPMDLHLVVDLEPGRLVVMELEAAVLDQILEALVRSAALALWEVQQWALVLL
jgi:hypothetical protein